MPFIALAHLQVTGSPVVDDRPDLGVAIVHLASDGHYYPSLHLDKAEDARALAAAFTKAAELLDAQAAAKASECQCPPAPAEVTP